MTEEIHILKKNGIYLSDECEEFVESGDDLADYLALNEGQEGLKDKIVTGLEYTADDIDDFIDKLTYIKYQIEDQITGL